MSKRMKAFLVAILIGGIVLTGVGLALAGNSRNSTATSQGTGNRYGVEGKHNGYRMIGDKSEYGFGMPGVMGRYRTEMGKEIASYLGITENELKTAIESGKSLATIATEHGKTEDALIQFIVSKETANLDTLLKDGKITQSQHDKIATNLSTRVKEMVERTEVGPMNGAFRSHGYRTEMGEEIASYLGITEDELRAKRVSGKSLAEIAEANDKTEEELISFIVSKRTEQLKSLLDEGKTNETRYETMLNNINKRVKEMVERTEVKPMNEAFGSHGFKGHDRGLRPGIGKCNP